MFVALLHESFSNILIQKYLVRSTLTNALDDQEVHDYLKSLCPDLHITRGEYDEDSRYPETKTLTIGQFKLGICHGHQVWFSFCFSQGLFTQLCSLM